MNTHSGAINAASDGVFVNNDWQPSASGAVLDVADPSTGKVFTQIAAGNADDIDAAVTAARQSLDGDWGYSTATQRGRILMRMSQRIIDELETLAEMESRDTGKPIAQARADITAAARYFEYYGGAADKVHGNVIPFLPGHFVATEYVRYGVTGHIIPWNYPAQMFGRTIAASLAMGNACVLKPAEDACLTPLRMAELLRDSGLPSGALNVVPGRGAEAGAALSAHRGVDFISFTGSPEAGALVQQSAAQHHIACTLELGGKSPQIIFADADLDRAMPIVMRAITQNAGQTCSAGARLLVEESIADAIIKRLKAEFPTLTAAPPGADRDLGPLINPKQLARVQRFCEMADFDAIPLIAEGSIDTLAAKDGYYIAPRAYGPVPRDHALARQEVFGPVLSLMTFSDEADAVALANDTEYGLVAGIWSRDGSKAIRVARQMMVGQIYINSYGAGGGIELPFGGMKKSGHGREKGFDALYEFAATRTMVIRHD